MKEELDLDVIREIVSMIRYSPLRVNIKKKDCNWFYEERTGKNLQESFSVKRAVLLELHKRNVVYNLIRLGELVIGEKR